MGQSLYENRWGILRLKAEIFKYLFLFLREREHMCEQKRREREEQKRSRERRERIPSRLCGVSAEPNVGLYLMNREIMT